MGGLRQGWGRAGDLDSRGCLQGGLIQKTRAPPNSKGFPRPSGASLGGRPSGRPSAPDPVSPFRVVSVGRGWLWRWRGRRGGGEEQETSSVLLGSTWTHGG